ncbi:MAG: hypothetical protein EOP36_11480 [Rubrivivax sp.]|nr:MAG: hypothetical protein EOP36_11480 [Rubrivivax sp.]
MFRIPDTARLLNSRRTGVAVAACLAVTTLVAGCGGGDRVKSFQPTQIIAFGDEASAFDDTVAAASASDRLVQFNGGGVVSYAARYTINVVADSPTFSCKTAAPDKDVTAGCSSNPNATLSTPLVAADIPSNAFVLPQSSVSGNVRTISSIIPIVNEVVTGTFRDLSTGVAVSGVPSPIYLSTDHIYYCSMDFGNGDFGNWVQRVAHGLGGSGLSLGGASGCPQDLGNGRSFAKWGAKVDDVNTQVMANLGALRDGVLVTMLAGQNDIMAAYQSVRTSPATSDAAHKLMRDKGAQLAGIINTIVGTGARVVYLTVPDMGKSPEAIAEPGLATTLTHAFNEGYKGSGEGNESGGLVLSVINNGHKIVKVDGYNLIASLGATYGAVSACELDPAKVVMPNGTTVAAAAAAANPVWTSSTIEKAVLLNCRSNNLRVISGNHAASPPTPEVRLTYVDYLWADGRRLAPIGHAQLAALAVSRVRDQL